MGTVRKITKRNSYPCFPHAVNDLQVSRVMHTDGQQTMAIQFNYLAIYLRVLTGWCVDFSYLNDHWMTVIDFSRMRVSLSLRT